MGRLLALAAVLLGLALRLRSEETPALRPPERARPVERPPETARTPGNPDPAPATPRRVNRVILTPRAREIDPAAESPIDRTIRGLLREQNGDGSWGDGPVWFEGHFLDRVGLTGFGLGAFLANGYSHLSKDEYDGVTIGHAVGAASRFLRERVGPDGRFAGVLDPALEQALGAFALSEHYGLTASAPVKEPAQLSLDALWGLQRNDGSWGTRSQTDWALLAVCSAKWSNLDDDPDGLERLRGHYARREAWGPDPGAALFRRWVLRERDASLEATAAWIAAQPVPADPDAFGRLYFHAWALRDIDGPTTSRWRAWHDSYREAKRSAETLPGATRSQTVLRTSLALLDATLYPASTNITGVK